MKELNQQEIQAISGAGDWKNIVAGSTFGAFAGGSFGFLAGGPMVGAITFLSGGFIGGLVGFNA